jgi:WXG100 protein secretion system (Wss), protein YukD
MSVVQEPRTLEVALRHPNGEVRLRVPADVPLAELIPDLLGIAELPDDTGWAVSRSGNDEQPYPKDRTLAQLAAADGASLDGATLDLHPQLASPPPTTESAEHATPFSEPWTAPEEPGENDRDGSLHERTATRLPGRLSRPARARLTVRALASDPAASEPSRAGSSPTALDPATFTRPARVSPAARMRATCE